MYHTNKTREQCDSHDKCMYRDEPLPGGYHCYYTGLYYRLSNAEIRVGNQWDFRRNALCYKIGEWPQEKSNQTFKCHKPLVGRYVSIERRGIQGVLTICEAQIHELIKWQNPVTNLPGLFPHKAKMRWTPETVDFKKLYKRDKGIYFDETQTFNSQVPHHYLNFISFNYHILIFTLLII